MPVQHQQSHLSVLLRLDPSMTQWDSSSQPKDGPYAVSLDNGQIYCAKGVAFYHTHEHTEEGKHWLKYKYPYYKLKVLIFYCFTPVAIHQPPWGPGGFSQECVLRIPSRCRKRRLNEAVSRSNRIKRVAACRCLDGHVKEPATKCLWRWEPDRSSNLFFSPPVHILVYN